MKIYVIGGGAAGIMAAISAKDDNNQVTILEKNEKLAKKLFITGKGRCNITNTADYQEYFNNIISNKNFMRGALKVMPPDNVINLLNENGLKTKVERGGRVFPLSDKSSDVIKTFEKIIKEKNINIIYNQSVKDIVVNNFNIIKIKTQNNEYFPDKVILATGGKSYKATGSDGFGYQLAKHLGHTIIEPKPALIPIVSNFCYNLNGQKLDLQNMPSLQGLSLKNVECGIIENSQKTIFKEFGEMLFTHNGLSGPIILTLSSKINRLNLKELKISIDLKPALDFKTLDNRLIREFEQNSNKNFKNSLNELLPSKLIPFIIKLSNIPPDKIVNSLTKEERKGLVRLLKNLQFEITSLDDINNAIITAGGVSTKEINPKTMRSKIINNLYFAGEIIDIDALTGGFNLQLAFSTGYIAGSYAKQKENI